MGPIKPLNDLPDLEVLPGFLKAIGHDYFHFLSIFDLFYEAVPLGNDLVLILLKFTERTLYILNEYFFQLALRVVVYVLGVTIIHD